MQPSHTVGTNPHQFECPKQLDSFINGLKRGYIIAKKVEGTYTVSVYEPSKPNVSFGQTIQLGSVEIVTNCGTMSVNRNIASVCSHQIPMNPDLIEKGLECAKTNI